MTKDWDAVQDEIRNLSFVQKKPLEEIRTLMQRKHNFRASTRAYRMRLAEWGLTKHNKPPRRKRPRSRGKETTPAELDDDALADDSSVTVDPMSIEVTPGASTGSEREVGQQAMPTRELEPTEPTMMDILYQSQSLDFPIDPLHLARTHATTPVMDMLGAILDNDPPAFEKLLVDHSNHINDPLGLPFDLPNSRFYNHPIMQEMVILQHPDQTLLDVASGMPCGPIIWILMSHGAEGSRHPLGTDLALHNAIKNGRALTSQALLLPGRSDPAGVPGTSWKPILQAVFWNHPAVVRVVIRKGAPVNITGPSPYGPGNYTALQLCLDRRARDYHNQDIRTKCDDILKQLLDAGADIHVPPPQGSSLSPFEMFLKPMQTTPYWAMKMSPLERECLGLFISNGADPQTQFKAGAGFPCSAESSRTFAHQAMWHSTPAIARLVIDSVSASPHSTGLSLLNEILGSCPDAKRHPADTLRDIEVLLSAGVDPNLSDITGTTPLRRCLEHCPAVDLVARLRKLLDAGADPEAPGPDGVAPYVLAARTFDAPLLAQVMEALVSKIQGRHAQQAGDAAVTWAAAQFPITADQTYEQVMSSVRSTGDFRRKMLDMVPADVHQVFLHAYFSVVSAKFLDSMTRAAKARTLLPKEKDEIVWVLGMRPPIDCPAYVFDQELVLALLDPPPVEGLDVGSTLETPSTAAAAAAVRTSSSTPPSPPHAPFTFNPNSTIPSPHRSSPEPTFTHPDADFFIPEATTIRWHDPCAQRKPDDLARTVDAVVQFPCPTCDDGKLLTRAELAKHEVEHEHAAACGEGECKRRFCVRRAGTRGDGG